jgi:hypothetical protein
MSCEPYLELISAELDVELDPDGEVNLWRHLSGCERCRNWRRDQLVIRRDLESWPEEALPERMQMPVPGVASKPSRVYRVPRPWAWAAGILILLQGSYLVSNSVHQPGGDAGDNADDAETILLTMEDRTRYGVEEFRLPGSEPGQKLIDGGQNEQTH